MKRVLSVGVLLVLCCLPVLAGELLTNDTGQTVYGLSVTFSEPVTITGCGDTLLTVEPKGVNRTFTFHGGEVDPWNAHWITWEPSDAELVASEWLLDSAAVFRAAVFSGNELLIDDFSDGDLISELGVPWTFSEFSRGAFAEPPAVGQDAIGDWYLEVQQRSPIVGATLYLGSFDMSAFDAVVLDVSVSADTQLNLGCDCNFDAYPEGGLGFSRTLYVGAGLHEYTLHLDSLSVCLVDTELCPECDWESGLTDVVSFGLAIYGGSPCTLGIYRVALEKRVTWLDAVQRAPYAIDYSACVGAGTEAGSGFGIRGVRAFLSETGLALSIECDSAASLDDHSLFVRGSLAGDDLGVRLSSTAVHVALNVNGGFTYETELGHDSANLVVSDNSIALLVPLSVFPDFLTAVLAEGTSFLLAFETIGADGSLENPAVCEDCISTSAVVAVEEEVKLLDEGDPAHLHAVIDGLEYLGNPYLERYPCGSEWDSAREINDLEVWNDQLYLGAGGYSSNAGPVDVWRFDPASGDFASDYRVDDEAIGRFRVFDDHMYIPGIDAIESWEFGNVYRCGPTGWRKIRRLPSAIHVYDVAEFDGMLVAAGAYADDTNPDAIVSGGALYVSRNQGASWECDFIPCTAYGDLSLYDESRPDVGRFYRLFEFRDRLFAFGTLLPRLYVWNGTSFEYLDVNPFPSLLSYGGYECADVPYTAQALADIVQTQEEGDLWRPCAESIMDNILIFNGRLVYSVWGMYPGSSHKWNASGIALYAATDLLERDIERLQIPAEDTYIEDLIVVDSLLIALVYQHVGDGYKTLVFATEDFVSWREVFSFSAVTYASAIEYLDGYFYLGLGGAALNTGDLYRFPASPLIIQ